MKTKVCDNRGMWRFRGYLAVFSLVLFSGCKEEAIRLSPQELHKSTESSMNLQMGSGRSNDIANFDGSAWHFDALKLTEPPTCTDYSTTEFTIGVSDTGLDSAHSQLNTGTLINFLGGNTIDPHPDLAKLEGDHGTSVGGIIGAKCNQQTRSIFPEFPFAGMNIPAPRGIIPGFPLGGMNLIAPEVKAHPDFNSFFISEPTQDFRIVNQSWGSLPSFWLQSPRDQEYALQVATEVKKVDRIFVKAAGNEWPQDAAYDPQNQSPYIVVVAASNRTNAPASFSQAGANLWVTAPGEDIDTLEATLKQNYNYNFSGTSAAAPMVTGVIALMLEKNSDLTWRDIKYILAKTAAQVGTSGWTKNQAGFHFHRDYGFGLVDAREAVLLAQSSNLASKSWGDFKEQSLGSQSPSLSIPDNQEEGITSSINTTQNLTIEALELTLNITHRFPSDLRITLTSPSNTEAIVLEPHPGFYTRYPHMRNIRLMVNHFYGETTNGDWTLEISDRWQEDAGTLESWSLKAYGH